MLTLKKKEYNNTLDAYIKELEADMNEDGDDEVSLSGLVVDKEDIKRKLDKITAELKQFIPMIILKRLLI